MMRIPTSMVVWLVVIAGLLGVALLSGSVEPSWWLLGLLALCFACELMDSSLGMGFGTTLTPVLLIAGYDPLQLVPTILISEFLSGFASFFFHTEAGNVSMKRGSIHIRVAATLALFSIIGVVAGVQLALNISKLTLTRLIGVVILVAGITILAMGKRQFRYRHWKVALLGLAASFNKAVSGGGYGPLMTSGQILSGVDGKAAIGITSFAEGFTCLGGAAMFLLLGQAIDLKLLIPVVAGALFSVPFSAQIVRLTREDLVRKIIAGLTLLLGILTLGRTFVA